MFARNTNNSIIKATLKSKHFRKDSSVHKYAVLWASKFYRIINRIMRMKTFEEQVATCPYAIRYIKHFLKYFETHGVTSDQLSSKTRSTVLYRGLTAGYPISQEMKEDGFMSTTYKKHVAKSFAGNGNVLSFDIKKLPKNAKFAVIDQEIQDHLMEYEVLFLPGTIRILGVSEFVDCSYAMNKELINKYSELTHNGGGDLEDIPDIDPAGKLVVWYRAITDRPVEIVAQMFVPEKDTVAFFKQNVLTMDDSLQRSVDLIPEKKDCCNIYMALYDYKKKMIDTLHYGLFDSFFKNMFDQKRTEEAEAAIKGRYSWL